MLLESSYSIDNTCGFPSPLAQYFVLSISFWSLLSTKIFTRVSDSLVVGKDEAPIRFAVARDDPDGVSS